MNATNTLLIFISLLFLSCKKELSEKTIEVSAQSYKMQYAKGFEVETHEDYKLIKITKPWPKATKTYNYLLLDKNQEPPKNISYDELIRTPISSIVVTSTTHIHSLEALGVESKLVGFPNTRFISSPKTRGLIDQGKVKELGKNESLNTEVLIDLNPDVVIGFSIDGSNKTYETLKKASIPVLYNAAWVEEHALGRAEWIIFFGHLFNLENKATGIYNDIIDNYKQAQEIALNAKYEPSVLCGTMFKDTWHLPYGNSWATEFLNDANANYLWKETKGSGSIALNFESVLEKAQNADFWVAPSSHESLDALLKTNSHYQEFDAFKNKKVYMANKKGPTGGLLFYEVAPNRPDLMLKDLIKIFHPELLPNYELNFYSQLK